MRLVLVVCFLVISFARCTTAQEVRQGHFIQMEDCDNPIVGSRCFAHRAIRQAKKVLREGCFTKRRWEKAFRDSLLAGRRGRFEKLKTDNEMLAVELKRCRRRALDILAQRRRNLLKRVSSLTKGDAVLSTDGPKDDVFVVESPGLTRASLACFAGDNPAILKALGAVGFRTLVFQDDASQWGIDIPPKLKVKSSAPKWNLRPKIKISIRDAKAKRCSSNKKGLAVFDYKKRLRRLTQAKKQRKKKGVSKSKKRFYRSRRTRRRIHRNKGRAMLCCDGTYSPSCLCGQYRRGCCSRHGGDCGC